MDFNSANDLRQWAASIETALGITLGSTETGAFVLHSTAGAMLGIEPVPGMRALALTGQIGVADGVFGERKLRALLALNLTAGLSGTGVIGVAPDSQAVLVRLLWTPVETAWTEEIFTAVLAAFAEHVDALSAALANGEIEQVLTAFSDRPPVTHIVGDSPNLA
ncbi:MAG: type III secretion system chaperone [Burkholderiaceae bacterium]|nr:type III secretion system chaperone [Burkholderiaceae bacterium]